VTYTATAKNGATGFSSGSGNISQSLNLPPGSSVTSVISIRRPD